MVGDLRKSEVRRSKSRVKKGVEGMPFLVCFHSIDLNLKPISALRSAMKLVESMQRQVILNMD